jgi:hypothetical protein
MYGRGIVQESEYLDILGILEYALINRAGAQRKARWPVCRKYGFRPHNFPIGTFN